MKENRLLFTNALIVLPTETIKGSLAVEDGKITGIFESGTELPGFTEVDVHGKALMPGAIDTHVHMWDPSPLNYREDWACGSQCAASGGITTIIDMPLSVPPVVDKEGFQLKLDVAQKESCVDFAFWGGLTPNCVQNMEELNRLGCVAYKGFMSFANPDYPQVTDGYLVQGMRKAATFNGLIGVHAENAEVADFGSKEMSAMGVIYMVILFVIASFIFRYTKIGKYACAIGSNCEATRLSGVDTRRWTMLVYIIAGVFAGLAGIFYSATYTSVLPGSGSGMEMNAIAAVVIGGTSLSGGSGTMLGTIIGVFIMAVLKNGLMTIGIQQQWQVFFTGLAVLLAVMLDIYRSVKLKRS